MNALRKINAGRFCLRTWGPYAAFNRPELKVERVSYDVITPSAARGIFTTILWKPAIRWRITEIEVLKPIRRMSIRKNEIGKTAIVTARPCGRHKTVLTKDEEENEWAVAICKPIHIEDKGIRQQRAGICLRDVEYRLHAEMDYLPPGHPERRDRPRQGSEESETPVKYREMFLRRAAAGQTFHQPYFGTRECAANFILVKEEDLAADRAAHPALSAEHDCDFGVMLYDMDFDADENDPPAMFFRAVMKNGVVEVPGEGGILR